jgi:hypothetical protein
VVKHIAFLLFIDINCLETVENIESHICLCHKLVSYFYFYIFAAYVSALDLDKLSKTLKPSACILVCSCIKVNWLDKCVVTEINRPSIARNGRCPCGKY